MQKDVIYIDVEDDITAIIDKVKKSKEKVVALVPPKRIGVLQSAVNLRLLTRTAGNANKHIVLITNNSALTGLAASARIPVAKNLQSKPEVASVPASKVDDDDVIEGEDLPASNQASTDELAEPKIPVSKVENIDIDGDTPRPAAAPGRPSRAKKGIKVPDFGTFRKKIFILAGGGVLLIAFLVWAIVFAPRATIVISAKTSDQNLSSSVSVGPSVTTDSSQTHLQSIVQQDKATQSIEFDATGSKDIGDKATGTVVFSTNSIGDLGTTIPAGTQLITGGLSFVTTQPVTISISNYQGVSAGITAVENGTQYNGASGNMSGAPGGIKAKITGETAGGTSKVVKVVTQSDVDKAASQLAAQNNDDLKKKLTAKFENGTVIIDSSFKSTAADPTSSPAVGQQADSKAKLTQDTSYSIMGIAKAQLSAYLTSAFEGTLSSKNQQKIYDNGISTVKFADFKQNDGDQAGVVTMTAVAQVGPKIDDNEIKQEVKGKRYGEIAGDLRAIDGVSDVDVKLSPFWVQGVPNDVNKITVEFKLLKSNG